VEEAQETENIDLSNILPPTQTTVMYSPSGVDDVPRGVGVGAGSIMYTKVVQDGWKFPYVHISDIDEKYLFDIEVSHSCHFSTIC
jgi:hypothetical protein